MEKYKVLLYSGNLDICVGAPLTERMIYNLNWSGTEGWRAVRKEIWKIDNNVAGYVRKLFNFYYVIVR